MKIIKGKLKERGTNIQGGTKLKTLKETNRQGNARNILMGQGWEENEKEAPKENGNLRTVHGL